MTIAPTSPSSAPIIGPPPLTGRDGLYVRLEAKKGKEAGAAASEPTADQVAFQQLLRGIHF